MRALGVVNVVAMLMSCVTDAPAIPAHLDPASDQISDSPQSLERSLAGDVPREAQPLDERKAEPQATKGPAPTPAPVHPAAKAYVCPMHPEVRQGEPGECPKCGMRLVAETAPDAGSPPPRKAAPGAAKPTPTPAATVYTCPMHPEIQQAQPGRCPKCGMKLEPAAGGHGEHP